MFNTTIIRPGPSHVSVDARIDEHRAATDESVRLLKEFEEAALSKLIGMTRLENNVFHATVHIFQDFMSDSNSLIIRFQLNGTDHEIRLEILRKNDPRKAVVKIRDEIATKLATIMLKDVLLEAGSEIERLLRR